jgi:hypothetical protein
VALHARSRGGLPFLLLVLTSGVGLYPLAKAGIVELLRVDEDRFIVSVTLVPPIRPKRAK